MREICNWEGKPGDWKCPVCLTERHTEPSPRRNCPGPPVSVTASAAGVTPSKTMERIDDNKITIEETKEAEKVLGYTLKDIKHWAAAVKHWHKAGMPVRTPEQVEAILVICNTCDKYDKASERCSVCRCGVNRSLWVIKNKARMGTERCEHPDGAKWLPVATSFSYENVPLEIVESRKLPDVKPKAIGLMTIRPKCRPPNSLGLSEVVKPSVTIIRRER